MTADDAPPPEVLADTAALAANSAERAQEAAAATMEHAHIAVAGVTEQAAAEIARTQEGLAQWQTSIQARNEELAAALRAQSEATETKLAEIMDRLTSIQSQPERRRESPESPGREPSEPEAGEAAPPADPPPEPSPPAKRKAHRWI